MALCNSCGQDNKKNVKFCSKCGTKIEDIEIEPKSKYDIDLGKINLRNIFSFAKKQPEPEFPTSFSYRGMNRYKSEGTTLALSLFISLLGFMGVGHRYVGNVTRSLIIFGIGLVIGFLWLSIWLPLVGMSLGQFLGQSLFPPFSLVMIVMQQVGLFMAALFPDPSDPLFVSAVSYSISIGIIVAIPVGYYTFLIWQIFDAREQCRKFNLYMDESGEQLWKVPIIWKIIYGLGLASPAIAVLLILTWNILEVYFRQLLA